MKNKTNLYGLIPDRREPNKLFVQIATAICVTFYCAAVWIMVLGWVL